MNSEAIREVKTAISEKILSLLEKESNPALHKGIREYFEWVRCGEVMKDLDLKVEFVRASGPGGQNVNKVSSAVTIWHNPSRISLKEMGFRTQSENLSEARKRMFEKLVAHLDKWKLVAKGKSTDEVMVEMFEEANVGRKLEPRENEVMEEIARCLRGGKNL